MNNPLTQPWMANPVLTLHARADFIVNGLRRNPNFNPPCKAGCFWCCYEFLIVEEREAERIIDGTPLEQLDALKAKVRDWMARAAPFLNLPYDAKIGLRWRRLNLPCPLLGADGKCSVYEKRPFSCRSFFAKDHAENCAMPQRANQKFLAFEPGYDDPFTIAMHDFILEVDTVNMDHLGVHLHNILFGTNIKTAVNKTASAKEMTT